MRRFTLMFTFVLLLFPALTLMRAGEPERAQKILDSAVREADTSHRAVFIIFHASWCGWCKKLDAVLDSPDVKRLIDENYVVVRLDVQERREKVQTLENPGGQDIMKEMGGSDAGLPFYAFLDGKRKKIADSKIEGPEKQNVGYPGSAEEIALFEKLLKQTAPRMTDQARARVIRHFAPEGT
jgi:thioredoxin-related protein